MENKNYEAPNSEVMEVCFEGVICVSVEEDNLPEQGGGNYGGGNIEGGELND